MHTDEAIAKLPFFVTPAKAGEFNLLNDKDSCFRRNDKKLEKGNFAIASDVKQCKVELLLYETAFTHFKHR